MFHRLASGVILFVCDDCLLEFKTVADFMAAWDLAKKKGWQPALVGSSVVFGSTLCRKCKEKSYGL